MDLAISENMSEIDITEDIEKEEKVDEFIKKEAVKGEEMISKQTEEMAQTSNKPVLIMVGVIVLIFVAAFTVFEFSNSITGSTVVTIDDLHQMNVEGELDSEKGYLYNGFSFVKEDNLWWTQIETPHQGLIMTPLHFGPKDLEDIPITGKLGKEFNKGNKVYILIDPLVQNQYYTLAVSEMSVNLAQGISRMPEAACTEEHYACENRPVINCEDSKEPVIEFIIDDEASVKLDGACIKVSGRDADIVRSVDRLLYRWYRVME